MILIPKDSRDNEIFKCADCGEQYSGAPFCPECGSTRVILLRKHFDEESNKNRIRYI